MVKQLRLCAPNAGGPGSIPGQGTRSRTPHGAAKKKKRKGIDMLLICTLIISKTEIFPNVGLMLAFPLTYSICSYLLTVYLVKNGY